MRMIKTEYGEFLNTDSVARLYVLQTSERTEFGDKVIGLMDHAGASIIAELLSGTQIEVSLFNRDNELAHETDEEADRQAQLVLDALSADITSPGIGIIDAIHVRNEANRTVPSH